MLEERYNNLMEGVEPSPELVQRTLRAARPHRSQTGAWKPVLVIALCVVMVVGAAAWRVMNTGIIPPETASTNDTPTILPVSDELTLSVSDVTLVDEHKLSFILTVQGNLIDPQTRIDYDIEGIHKIHGSCYTLDPMPEQPDNLNRYQITLENKERPILLDAADTAELRIWRYTSGDTQSDQIHTVDWSTLPDTLPEECSPVFLRPPGGCCSDAVVQVAQARNLAILSWSVDPRDWATTDTISIERTVMNTIRDGDIVLLHDMSASSVQAALDIIDSLQKDGFRFVTASELAKLRGVKIQPGETYKCFPPEDVK